MKENFLDKLKLLIRTWLFILGIMIIPILVLDLIVPQHDYTMIWWAVLFSAVLTVIDIVFDWIPVFREKVLLKRIMFFIVLTAVLMGTSWIMGIVTTVPVLLSGIAGCLIAAVPATIYLCWVDKKNAENLNDSLREYNVRHSEDEIQ